MSSRRCGVAVALTHSPPPPQVTEVRETWVKCKALDDIDIDGNNMYHVHMPGCSAIPALTHEDKEVSWSSDAH